MRKYKRSFFREIYFIFFLVLWCIPAEIYCQQNSLDSLKAVVELSKKDSTAVNSLNELSSALLAEGQFEESLKFAEKAEALANEIKFTKGKAYALKQIGLVHYYQGDYLEVFDDWTKSLENFEAIKDSVGIANLLTNLGTVYYSQGSYDKAIEFGLRSLSIAEKIDHPLRIVSALINIALAYGDNNKYDKALDYYDRAFPYLESLNNVGLSKGYYLGVGTILSDQGNYREALIKFEEALPITENTLYYTENLLLVGKAYFNLGEFEKANEYLNKAHTIALGQNQQDENVKILIEKGKINQERNAAESIRFYKEAEVLAKEINLPYELKEIYLGISKSYINTGDFKNGYEYQSKYIDQMDLIFNLETDDKIRGLQFEFDLDKKQDEIVLLEKEGEIKELEVKRQKNVIYGTIFSTFLLLLIAMGIFNRYKYVKKTNGIIEGEKEKSDNLLRNILPAETAEELKLNGKVAAKSFDSVTVFFSDFKGFTFYAQSLAPDVLVKSVDYYFSKFDQIIEKYGLEKIKTIGDAYMCAGGLPFPSEDHPEKMVTAAFEIAAFVEETKKQKPEGITCFDIRIGINTGPIVAGVVGLKKFAYDIWGDTVNVASRMESMSDAGKINVSEYTYELIKDSYDCEFRGEIEVKNKGTMKMYFVNGPKIISSNQSETERTKGLAPSLN